MGHIHDGSITVHQLQTIGDSFEPMKRLCNAMPVEAQKSLQGVELRLDEYRTFSRQRKCLHHLCNAIDPKIRGKCVSMCGYFIASIIYIYAFTGVSDAVNELHVNYDFFRMNTLCSRDESGVKVVCFHRAHVLLSFAWKFNVFKVSHNSDLFLTVWSDTLRNVRQKNPELSIDDLELQVWAPTFHLCEKLLEQLHNLSMTLGDVDRVFHHYEPRQLEDQLQLLHRGVCQCGGLNLRDHWIPKAVKKLEDYRWLCGYREAANSFLQLRELLKLSGGDFTDVEQISKEVKLSLFFTAPVYLYALFALQISSSMKDQTLADISNQLVEAGLFLRDFTGDRLECIQRFCQCQRIVEWIRHTTKGIHLCVLINPRRACARVTVVLCVCVCLSVCLLPL